MAHTVRTITAEGLPSEQRLEEIKWGRGQSILVIKNKHLAGTEVARGGLGSLGDRAEELTLQKGRI